MQISEFLDLDGEFQISALDAQKLNRELSLISASDIPAEKIDQVLDYLITALNVGAVDHQVKPNIEQLTSDLQRIRHLS